MRVLTENLGWKLFSLLIALGLWMFFVAETEIACSMPVVVEFRNVPPDLEITTDQPSRMFMKIRGPLTRVRSSAVEHTALVFDLANVHSPGEQTFTITDQDLRLPQGVRLIRAVPSQVRIAFERRSTRSVPVEIRITGGPPAGYRIAEQKVTPDMVRVTGPELKLGRLKVASTDPIDLSSTIGEAEFRVPVYVGDPQLRLESPAPVSVRILLEKISAL